MDTQIRMFFVKHYTTWHPLIRAFVESLCLLLVPYLLGFVLKSHAVLRAFAREESSETSKVKADTVKTIRDEPEMNPALKRRMMLGGIAFLLLTVVQLVLYVRSSNSANFVQIIRNIMEGIMYAGLLGIVVLAFFQMCGLPTWKTKERKPRKVATFLGVTIFYFAFCIVLGLSGSNNSLSVWVVTLALVYYGSEGQQLNRAKRLRGMFKFWAYHSLVLVVNVHNVLTYYTEDSPDEETLWPVVTLQSIYVSFLPAALASYFSGALISRMLRFDYRANAKKELELWSDMLEEAQEKPLLSASQKVITDGARFPKPYYTAAITAWSFIRVATIVLCLTTGFPAKSPYDACFYAILVEFPVMVAAVLFYGYLRGDAKSLWNDEELWTYIKVCKKGRA